jgi:hypothetical protein
MLAFASNFPNSALPPAFVILTIEFQTTYAAVARLLSWNILVLGLAVIMLLNSGLENNLIADLTGRTSSGCRWPSTSEKDQSSF